MADGSLIGRALADLRDQLSDVLEPADAYRRNLHHESRPSEISDPDDDSTQARAVRSFDERVLHPDLIALCRADFVHCNYADAARRATQYLSQDVLGKCREELQCRETARAKKAGKEPGVLKDGAALMQVVFSVDNPVLQVPPEMVTQSDKSEQIGYSNLMQGVIAAFRNPRSHDVFYEDDPLQALLIIELSQHLVEIAADAQLIATGGSMSDS